MALPWVVSLPHGIRHGSALGSLALPHGMRLGSALGSIALPHGVRHGSAQQFTYDGILKGRG